MRYAEWCTAAPSLEADIAAAAMGLDDLGHSRVLYGCLKELPDNEPVDEGTYANVRYLDQPWTDWSQFIAANAVLDTAFTLMIESLAGGNVEVLRSRLRKMLQEERYHYLHGRSWLKEVPVRDAVMTAWGEALEWFGPEGSDVDQLRKAGRIALGVPELRRGLGEKMEASAPTVTIAWEQWDPLKRRTAAGGIDERTLEMLQGLAERRYMPAGGQKAEA